MTAAPRKPIPGAPLAEPWKPHPYEAADASAIQALARGDANDVQQRRALDWIINMAGTYDLSYRPTGGADTAFAEGKRSVGLQIVKLTKIAINRLTGEKREQG